MSGIFYFTFLFLALTGYQPSTAFSIYNRDDELLFNAFEGMNVLDMILL